MNTQFALQKTLKVTYLHISFSYYNFGSVGVLHQLLQSLRVNVMQGHVGLTALGHLICSHNIHSCAIDAFEDHW